MIRRLDPHIVHQIAAGEVVERPASALKELLENALDAGASNISIEFDGGGLSRLVVEDNGVGMSADDLPLAFEAHATSKLKSLDDFKALATFGFRGEALCSLASVSDLEIWTSAKNAPVSTLGKVSFGVKENIQSADKRVGTRVTVKNLFSQHPARLKFMKTIRSETLALGQVFRRYALCEPNVSFSFRDLSGKNLERLPAQSLYERVLWFFDSNEADQWFDVEEASADWKVRVIALRPKFLGRAKSGIQFFLNNRPFKDSRLEFSVKRGFESFTLNPRDISAAVYLHGNPEDFDVNVHPMKSEVRFVDPDPIFSLVVRAIRGELEKEHRDIGESLKSPEISRSASMGFSDEVHTRPHFQRSFVAPRENPQVAPLEPMPSFFEPASEASSFSFLATLDNTYLICSRDADLYLFDQHALHERILYERLLKDFQSTSKIPSQRLLFPVPLSIQNVEVLMEQEEVLEKLGFELRLWNDGKVQMVAAPAILKRDHAAVLNKLSDCLSLPVETLAREVLATMACHSAVRAHDRLERPEIERLLKDFSSEDAVGHCPHGRPTYVKLQIKDLEKMFQRVV